MTKLIYLPAITSKYHVSRQFNGIKTNWWSTQSFIKHNAVLYSYFFVGKDKNFREEIGYPKENIFFADSGGFSVVTQGAKIDPRDVILWMNNNADIGVILDIPPYDFSGTAQFGGSASKKFKSSLEKTYENSKIMYDLWDRNKLKLYAVMQGETYNQKTEWLDKLLTIGEFSGCALSPKPSSDLFQIISHMFIALNRGIKNIHILQVSGKTQMAVIYYVAKMTNYFDLITFDSSTYIRLGAEFRKIFTTPFELGEEVYNKDFRGKVPCDCLCCSTLNNNTNLLQASNSSEATIAGLLLSLHNLRMKIIETDLLNKMTIEELEKMIDNQDIVSCVRMLVKSPQKQQEIEKMFEPYFNLNDKHYEQKGLFGFT